MKATKRLPPAKVGGKLNGSAKGTNGKLESNGNGKLEALPNGRVEGKPAVSRVATVSHTLESSLAERLREFAFRERISESAVIERALIAFFAKGDDATLGAHLRKLGAALRRKT